MTKSMLHRFAIVVVAAALGSAAIATDAVARGGGGAGHGGGETRILMISPAISLVRSCSRPVFGLARRGDLPRHHLPQFLRTQFIAGRGMEGRGTLAGRTMIERKIIHIPDVLLDSEYTSDAPRIADFRSGHGTLERWFG
jgi:hypothetical protein